MDDMDYAQEGIHPLELIREEVGIWSRKNFGNNRSKETGTEIGSLASLLGIVEELGELEASKTEDDFIDSVGDTIIYLLDFLFREELEITHIGNVQCPNSNGGNKGLVAVGRLSHAALKRHQGVRDFDDKAKFRIEVIKNAHLLLAYLHELCIKRGGYDLVEITIHTWSKVIKRDWKSRPGTG